MRLEELDFFLPEDAVAQHPAEPRDACRLMHLRADGGFAHTVFADLPELLRPGDTVVLNDSKVLPARVVAQKASGGTVELLFLRAAESEAQAGEDCWEALVRPSKRVRAGTELALSAGEPLRVKEELGEGRWLISSPNGCSLIEVMAAHGRLPLPPYVKSYPDDPNVYQTVYANVLGSAAAPTAGLHFTEALLERLKAREVHILSLTLHVGPDTFLPIRDKTIERHRIHSEAYEVPSETMVGLRAARSGNGRVVAVGTTVARTLETLAENGALAGEQRQDPWRGSTNIFITPGYRFTVVDALLTNFHLPRSTVLALAMAFAGPDRLMQAYAQALAAGYRFFSFGDAMLIEALGV